VDRFYWDDRIIGISLVSGCTLTLTSMFAAFVETRCSVVRFEVSRDHSLSAATWFTLSLGRRVAIYTFSWYFAGERCRQVSLFSLLYRYDLFIDFVVSLLFLICRRVSLTFRNLATKPVAYPEDIAQKLKIKTSNSYLSLLTR
jgi:hypothetical protein